jgi:hypothetical protein
MSISLDEKISMTVYDILRDKASGWNNDQFRFSPYTSADVPLARAIAGIERNELEAQSELLRVKLSDMEKSSVTTFNEQKIRLVEAMRQKMDLVKREMDFASDPKIKAEKRAEVNTLRDRIATERKDIEDQRTKEIHRVKGELEKNRVQIVRLTQTVGPMTAHSWVSEATYWSRMQMRERRRRQALQQLRNTFMVNGDLEALKEGVALVESEAARSEAPVAAAAPVAVAAVAAKKPQRAKRGKARWDEDDEIEVEDD